MQSVEGIQALLRMTAYTAAEAERMGLRFVKYCLDMAHGELVVVSRRISSEARTEAGATPRRRGRPRRAAELVAGLPPVANDRHAPAADEAPTGAA